MLAILGPYRKVQVVMGASSLPAARFRTGCGAAGLRIEGMSASLIRKYVADLRHLGLIGGLGKQRDE